MIEIDGSIGGGQIIRTALSLSVITNKPFKIVDIRGKRENSGLRNQHLTCVNAISQICNANVKGNEIGSTVLEFFPFKVIPNNYNFDIGTAGSTVLVLQTLLPALVFADKKSVIEIKGGTANPLAPPALDVKEVFLWFLKRLNINVHLSIEREGFYPKGGGIIKIIINPCKELGDIKFTDRIDKNIVINLFADCSKSLKDKNISKRLIKGFKLNFHISHSINCKEVYCDTLNSGCYIHANFETSNSKIGMTVLGEVGRKSEDVGKECALKLLDEINSRVTVDFFTADQLLIYLGLKGYGSIKVSHITDHIKTNITTIEKFLDVRFEIIDKIISCNKLV